MPKITREMEDVFKPKDLKAVLKLNDLSVSDLSNRAKASRKIKRMTVINRFQSFHINFSIKYISGVNIVNFKAKYSLAPNPSI
jgi:hypothetical protein